jgi:hypothetical protein
MSYEALFHEALFREHAREFCERIARDTFYLHDTVDIIKVFDDGDPEGGFIVQARFTVNHTRKEVDPARNVEWARTHLERRLPLWSKTQGRLCVIEEESLADSAEATPIVRWFNVGFNIHPLILLVLSDHHPLGAYAY